MVAQISRLLVQRLGAKGPDLETRVASRARLLPRKVRRAARLLAETERKARSPKLARQLDPKPIEAAFFTCQKYLEPLGAADRMRSTALGLASAVAVIIVLVGVCLLAGSAWLVR
ncbi:hypothetical protein DL1_05575 [Thioclava dalianensis]|uniref:Uncharacterized protein n=2 Tax=Thioclava dalianensis TaxID=1185766 RepID=A0A074TBA9_9RHOB|nr:hypothetical protein DL1_05575 [Thioclava dalianensis]